MKSLNQKLKRPAAVGLTFLIVSTINSHLCAGNAHATLAEGLQIQNTVLPQSPMHPKQHQCEIYSKRPIIFEANQGQADERVQFMARAPGYELLLMPGETVLAFHGTAEGAEEHAAANSSKDQKCSFALLHIKLLGANAAAKVEALDSLPGKMNYFLGNDPSKWHTKISTCGKVRYEAVYPGVDLVYYGNRAPLEYDYILAPGANPESIQLAFEGADTLTIDANGDLVFTIGVGQIRQHKPFIYQEFDGCRKQISGGYVL